MNEDLLSLPPVPHSSVSAGAQRAHLFHDFLQTFLAFACSVNLHQSYLRAIWPKLIVSVSGWVVISPRPQVAKMLLIAGAFRCIRPAAVIAAFLSVKSPFPADAWSCSGQERCSKERRQGILQAWLQFGSPCQPSGWQLSFQHPRWAPASSRTYTHSWHKARW